MSNQQFFTQELKENPEFFKAFPHLQKVFAKEGYNEDKSADLKYIDDKVVNFSNPDKE